MPRRLVLVSSCVGLALLGAVTLNCGSSSGSGGGGNGGPFNVVGDWQSNFSVAVGATASGYGAINTSGVAAFLDTSGNIVQLPTITGASSFSGNLTAYAVNGTFFSGGAVSVIDNAQGKVNSATSITGSFTSSPTSSGTFTVAPSSLLSGSAVPISGAMRGNFIGFVNTLQLTFSSNGSFTGVDSANGTSACGVNGTLTQDGTSNVFDISYTESVGSCANHTDTGIAFESKTDYFNVNGGADSIYLYWIMLTSTATQVRPYVVVIYQ